MIPIPRITLFILNKKKGEDDALLRCRVKWENSSRIVTFSVGYRVTVSRWNFETQSCVKGSTHSKRKTPAATINEEIRRYRTIVDTLFKRYEDDEVIPSEAEFKEAMNTALGNKVRKETDESLVSQMILTFITDQGTMNSWSKATYKAMNNMRNHLLAFDAGLHMDEFTTDTLVRYTDFLRNDVTVDGEVVKEGVRNSTLTKQLGYLRWFLKWADGRQLLKCRDYVTYHPRIKDVPSKVIFLEWDELMAIYNMEFNMAETFLHKYRDVFCFSCFTSLRFSDVMNLRWSDIHNNVMSVTTVKTADPVRIELNGYAQDILGRYAEFDFPDDHVFPRVVNQVMNRYLRELGERAGIDTPVHRTWYKGNERHEEVVPKWQLLTSHCGRRTFICHALSMGIAPNVVMKWTGHADYDSMRPYIAISQAATEEAMKKFDKQ